MQDEETKQKALDALRSDKGYVGDNPFKDELEKDMADPTTGIAEAWVKNGWTLDLLSKAVMSYASKEMKGRSGYQTSDTVFGWVRHIVVENLKVSEPGPDDGIPEEDDEGPKPKKATKKASKKEKPESPYVQESLF